MASTGLTLFGRGGLYTVALFLLRAGNFLLIPFYTAVLATDEYGAVGVVQQLVQLLLMVSLLGQGSALVRIGVDAEVEEGGLEGLLRGQLRVVAGLALGLTVATALAWPLLRPLLGGTTLWPIGLAGLVGVLGGAVFRIELAYLQLTGRARRHTGLNLLRWFLMLVLVVPFLAVLHWGAAGVLLASGLSFLLGSLWGLRELPKMAGAAIPKERLKAALLYGLPLVPHVLAGVLLQATDRALLAMGPGLEDAGVYTLAANLASVVFMVGMGMQRAWVPYFMRQDRALREQGSEDWGPTPKLSFFSVAVVGGVAVTVGLGSPELVALVSHGAYRMASGPLPILALGGMLRCLYLVEIAVVMAEPKTVRWLALATLSSAVLNVFLNLLWIPRWGLLGAAWATTLSHGASVIAVGLLARRARRVPFKRIRSVVLAATVGGLLFLGNGAELSTRLTLILAYGLALLVLDGRDILGAWRSLRSQLGPGRP